LMKELNQNRPRRLSFDKPLNQFRPSFFKGDDDNVSMENNTNIGRYDKRRRQQPFARQAEALTYVDHQVICAPNKEIDAVDFYEKSNYYIDLLRDDFATKRGNDWYELNSPVDV